MRLGKTYSRLSSGTMSHKNTKIQSKSSNTIPTNYVADRVRRNQLYMGNIAD